ncbi:hypothetical protein PENTCL1PPCAC_9029 [Pristionchus entomophagus]|uniref:Ribosomal protein n=1 Tax=Pristionchus entomophagus TaxID=358040 RepID=A0AAV5SVE0_9BILA|nr:hypothetical protein PENTCL1PPCAC_9029 [Pristionchus entomophagus]
MPLARSDYRYTRGYKIIRRKVGVYGKGRGSNDDDVITIQSAPLLARDVVDQVDDTMRVAVLVVVPGDQLDEVGVERDAGVRVEDGRVRVRDEVGRDNLVLSVGEHALHRSLGRLLDHLLDGGQVGGLLQTAREVDDRDVGRRHAEGHARQLAVEGGNHLSDGFGGSGRSGDDVLGGSATVAPQLARGAIHRLLRRGGGVHRGHQTLNDAKVVVDDLGEGREAVGGARSVGDDVVVGRVVQLVVDAHHVHRRVSRGRGDDHLLGASLEMGRGLVDGGEHAGRLHDEVGASRSPGDLGRVLAVVHLDPVGALALLRHDQRVSLVRDGALEAAVRRVVVEEVHHVVHVDEGVVDGDDLDRVLLDGGAQHETADAAKSVDSDSGLGHGG